MYRETFPGISYSGSEMTCIVDDNGDYYMYMYTLRDDLKLRTMSCSLDIPEDAHGGGALKQVKLPCTGTWVKSGGGGGGGGGCFQRGHISRILRYTTVWLLNCEGPTKILTALSRLHDV